ncbi:MAG: 2-succinyl-5-enolpyruvyl-6-hydroxy-3-cyclohexene-1-carboxylic-acid synthase [Actinomycetota bacterium]
MNPSTALATVLVDELVRGGVRHAVLCPGSRSAPLAYALHAADAEGRLTLHVRVDERSAGFVALGLAKASGPVVVVTTSGTAVANLHPAVLEADHGGVPLVVVTADRPPELRGTGANQTTDQVRFFGAAARFAHDLGVPDERPGQVATWRAVVARALAAATGARGTAPGPVQLNVPLREPLVPDLDDEPTFVEPMDGRSGGRPWVQVAAQQTVAGNPVLGPRTVVLVGDLPSGGPDWGSLAADLADAGGWPLLAEPSSGGAWARALPGGSLLLTCADWVDRHRPDAVLVVGRVTLSRAAAALLRHDGTRVEVVSDDPTWPDPGHRVHRVHPLAALVDPMAQGGIDPTWHGQWQQASARVADAARPVVEGSWPSSPAVAATVAGALPPGAVLFVGSSNPVRHLDLVAPAGTLVVANRGLAGIDGCVSTAAGLALARSALAGSAPTYALVGDLTFVHDTGALVVGPHEPQPDLTVVVVNDDGGGIFSLLEPGAPERAEPFDRVFGTAHGTDVQKLCAATGSRHVRVTDVPELVDAVTGPPRGITVVEVAVDRSGHRGLDAALRDAAAAAVG